MSVEALSVPLIIGLPNGIRTFSSFLYEFGLTSTNPDYGILAAAAVLVLILIATLMVIQKFVIGKAQRFVSVRGKVARSYVLPLGRAKWLGVALIVFYLVFGGLVPLAALVMRSFTEVLSPLMNPFDVLTLENYTEIFSTPQYVDTIVNSLIVSGIGAVAVSLVAIMAALIARRSLSRLRHMTEFLVLSALAIPGLVLSIGLFWAFSSLPRDWGREILLGTLLTLIIAFGIRAMPVAFASLASAIMQIHRELDDAARVSGADWLMTFSRIMLRLLVPSLVSSMVLVFIVMMKEYAVAIFLVTVDTEVIGSTMLSLWAQGTTGPVAALAVVQVLICLAVAAAARPFTRKDRNA
jgi:iron(III) transport system permease protein